MTADPRVPAGRRGQALDRLRLLTTATAVAGVAGTAGLAVVAAASWSGDPNATKAATVQGGPDDGTTAQPSTPPRQRNQAVAPVDPFGGSSNQGSSGIRPVQPGTGRNHATTGGSG
ncbi:MAG TPA: hypothetical protein VH440_06180 [Candidatus Limnocylindrales bacterium]|jgi:hypothetical protein